MRGLFGADGSQDEAVDKLEQLQVGLLLYKSMQPVCLACRWAFPLAAWACHAVLS